ncbi:IS1096 element passenger TnpR family protein [Paraburkholderia heleia]|uniref:IS1096 element passenger TnpR family protein n=1 Tax=Paraburkholderia heleia TaxID=634127 RepID=UPI0012ECF72E
MLNEARATPAKLLDGQNACPPEDVGGVPGYADLLEAITDPTHEEARPLPRAGWRQLRSAAFDLVLANQLLSAISPHLSRTGPVGTSTDGHRVYYRPRLPRHRR